MRIKSLMLRLLAAAAFVASVSVSCSEVSFIEINPPADLQEKIDSIQAVKDAANAALGDKTPVDIEVPIVGAEDYSSAWWTAFSQDFSLSQGKCLTVDLINHNGGSANNWSNWNLCVATGARGSDGYSEFFVIRSDAYGWGNADYNGAMFNIDYQDIDGDGDIWNDFRAKMDGASVSIEIDYASAGVIFVTATATSTDGVVMVEKYEQPVSGTTVTAFLIPDGSWLEIKNAWIEPSKIAEIPDEMAASIAVKGVPAALELGNTDFWGSGVATVTFADGSTAVADTADVTFVVPDLSTVGTKTILYSYSKTKQGNYGPAVAGFYTLDVINPIKSLEITTAPSYPKYYVFDAPVAFDPTGLVVTATYADETSGVIDHSMLTFGTVPADGTQKVEVSYVGNTSTVTVDCPVEVVKGTGAAGLADCSSGYMTHVTPDVVVPAGESKSVKYFLYSKAKAGENWFAAHVILRKADASAEYALLRMDNWGAGTGYETAVLESNWNWDVFATSLNMSTVEVTITNNGDGKADVNFDVTYANGEEHFQKFTGVTVDSSDLSYILVPEASYIVFID